MKKELIGYKWRDGFESKYEKVARIITGATAIGNAGEGLAFYATYVKIKNLKEAGVLDLWFEPVYKEKEVELIDGEIYCSEFLDLKSTIFRKGYTTLDLDINVFVQSEEIDMIDYDEIKPATEKQKKKLIKAEVKNGYFHELNKK